MNDRIRYLKSYRVHVYESGPNGKLTLFSLFNYMQDIASDHAELLGFGRNDLLRNNWFWVLSRMYVEIYRIPVWEETVELATWPNGTEKLFALRNYVMKFPDGTPAVSASSSWLVLDRDSKRIMKPANLEFTKSLEFPGDNPVRNPAKLDNPVEQGRTMHCFSIKASDLDVNLHTNNATYLRWIYDSYDLGFLMENDPHSVEINYLAESKYGEEIMIATTPFNGNTFDHSILRNGDGKELCRLRIAWNKSSKKV